MNFVYFVVVVIAEIYFSDEQVLYFHCACVSKATVDLCMLYVLHKCASVPKSVKYCVPDVYLF